MYIWHGFLDTPSHKSTTWMVTIKIY